ncbi:MULTISPECIES: cytochrome b [Legionella]|nr:MULTISPECIES: cytochrome b [Legionella]OJW12472.1 MAG: cytochrome B [Legionella sp. 39-23]
MERNKMNAPNHREVFQFDPVAKILHWILALLIIGMLILGWYMVAIGLEPRSHWYFNLHKSIGIIVGVLVLFRLCWRFFHRPGPYSVTLPLWQVKASRVVHGLLYALIILMPLTGFLGESFNKFGVAFFGLPISIGVNVNVDASNQLLNIHGIFAWILLTLIIIHILAALKHLLINKDNVFRRMWFSKRG